MSSLPCLSARLVFSGCPLQPPASLPVAAVTLSAGGLSEATGAAVPTVGQAGLHCPTSHWGSHQCTAPPVVG